MSERKTISDQMATKIARKQLNEFSSARKNEEKQRKEDIDCFIRLGLKYVPSAEIIASIETFYEIAYSSGFSTAWKYSNRGLSLKELKADREHLKNTLEELDFTIALKEKMDKK